jgi:hypothetical protein
MSSFFSRPHNGDASFKGHRFSPFPPFWGRKEVISALFACGCNTPAAGSPLIPNLERGLISPACR